LGDIGGCAGTPDEYTNADVLVLSDSEYKLILRMENTEIISINDSPWLYRSPLRYPILSTFKVIESGIPIIESIELGNYFETIIHGDNFTLNMTAQLLSDGEVIEGFCVWASKPNQLSFDIGVPEGGANYYSTVNQLRILNLSCSYDYHRSYVDISKYSSDIKSINLLGPKREYGSSGTAYYIIELR